LETGIYVALSGQLALQRRLDTIANNVANSTTAGFRAENVTFETVLSQSQQSSVAYSGPGQSTFSRQSGPITQTANPLDVAIHGDAFMSINGANGPVYTRDGRMHVSTQGDLENMNGQQILDQSGGPTRSIPIAARSRSRGTARSARTANASAASASSRFPQTPSSSATRAPRWCLTSRPNPSSIS